MICTSKSVVNDIMTAYGLSTFYGVGKLMEKNPQTVANWVNRGSTLDNESSRIAADLLNIDYEYLLICMEAERAKKNPATARAWEHIAHAWNAGKVASATTCCAVFSIYLLIPDNPII
jgi:hypothetical protein